MLQDEFYEVYREMFTDDADAAALFDKLDQQHTDRIDYVSFIDQIKVADIPQLTSKCRERGPLTEVRCTPDVPHLMLPRRSAPCNSRRVVAKTAAVLVARLTSRC